MKLYCVNLIKDAYIKPYTRLVYVFEESIALAEKRACALFSDFQLNKLYKTNEVNNKKSGIVCSIKTKN